MSIVSQYSKTFFNGTDIVATTNFVYNATGDSDADAGWKTSKGDYVSVLTRVATLNATSLRYRIEGRMSNGYTNAASIYTASVTAAQSIDNIIPIAEYVNEIRLGVKANNNASPNNFYGGIIVTEIK